MKNAYVRNVALICPTCGGDQFSFVSSGDGARDLQSCSGCGREITRAELIRENSENIDEHMKEVASEVKADAANMLKKQLAVAFKGSKFIKIK